MKLQNPYTKGYIEYPVYFELAKLNYTIRHETPFTERFSEWAVSILATGDMVYIPCGDNRSDDIYIVTRLFIEKKLVFPKGICTIPMRFFTERSAM